MSVRRSQKAFGIDDFALVLSPPDGAYPSVDASSAKRRFAPTDLAAWAMLVIVAALPFFYGGTRLWTQQWLFFAVVGTFVLWAVGLGLEGRRIRSPKLLLWAVSALLVQGWCTALFMQQAPLDGFSVWHIGRLIARWSTSVTVRTPLEAMMLPTATLLTIVMISDVADRTHWKRRFVSVMILAAVGVVAVGLAQNMSHARGIYWEKSPAMPGAFFGPFFHHTAAGAFINLGWMLAVAGALYAVLAKSDDDRGPRWRALFYIGAASVLAVGHLGHVSRMPQVIGLVVGVGLLVMFRPWRASAEGRKTMFRWGLVGVAGLAVLLAISGSRLGAIMDRWEILFGGERVYRAQMPPPPVAEWQGLVRDDLHIPYDHSGYLFADRGAAYVLAWRTIQETPWLGYGPGGWTAAAAEHSADPFIRTFYLYVQFTHEDYLQTLVEWGFVGGVFWAIVVIWPQVAVWRRQFRVRDGPSAGTEGNLCRLGAAAALLAMGIQACYDFPWQIGANQFYGAVLLGICWTRSSESTSRPRKSLDRAKPPGAS